MVVTLVQVVIAGVVVLFIHDITILALRLR